MDSRREMVLKALLSRCSAEERHALERFLPEEERLALSALSSPSSSSQEEEFANSSNLEKVHWSWFLPTLKTYSEREQRLFIASLDPHTAEAVSSALSISAPPEEISEIARAFFRQQLLHSFLGDREQILPSQFLPASPLNRLLSCNKKELIEMIDLLSLYDLHYELRQIVETKILKKIYSFLTEEQRNVLKKITALGTNPLPKLGLERWDGSEETLRNILHKRGLARLGAALSGQDPDLTWAICHRLDIGRGGALFKLCKQESMPGISENAVRQVEEIIGIIA